MQHSELCTQTSPVWREKYADVFAIQDSDGCNKTVFRYEIPFRAPKDAIIQKKHALSAQDRVKYYQSLAQSVHRHVEICNLLKAKGTPSVLLCEAVTQETDSETGNSQIFIQTESVMPIQEVLFKDGINILTLLDVFIRLSVIVRDLSREDCGVSHRGISMDHIYINKENKIVLGGFYYATAPEFAEILPYLPDHPRHLPLTLLQGATGSAGTDMQTLARLLCNFLSGLPWDTQWPVTPRVAPAYAPEGLAEILWFGMNCEDADCNMFRRQLLNYRKELSKTEQAKLIVPIHTPLKKQYAYR